MIRKFALSECSPVTVVSNTIAGEHCPLNQDGNIIRTASGKILIEPNSDKSRILEAELKKHPTALFFRSKAIKADEPNSNGDYFSSEELIKSYKTFEGVPFFTNHENQDIEKAKGKIIFAEWVPEEKSIYTISFVDREAYPHICRSIEQGYASGVSMGAAVEYSDCNICGNRAEKVESYCEHIRNRKARKFTGSARNVKTGEVKQFKNELVFEYNYGIKFIELSAVVDPACPSCRIQGIITNTDYLGKAANMENFLRMVKEAAIEKKAGKQEVEQIDQCLQTLEGIAINLIQNRKQVEVSFASDLVEILSNLQEWMDELIGAGYGNMESNVPGTAGNAPGDEELGAPEGGAGEMTTGAPAGGLPTPPAGPTAGPTAGPAGAPPSAAPAPAPVAASTSTAVGKAVGTVAGTPGSSAPHLPITAPVRPKPTRAEVGDSVIKKASKLLENIKTGDLEMLKRRTSTEKQAQKDKTIKILSEVWQEKQKFCEYIKEVPSIKDKNYKLAVKKNDDTFVIVAEDENSDETKIWTYEEMSEEEKGFIQDNPKTAAIKLLEIFKNKNLEGVNRMSDNTKQAGATSVNANPEVITEKQLDEKRDLYHPRTGEEQNSVTQKQLDSARKDQEEDVVTEKQLANKSNKMHPRTEETPEVVTEAQLKGKNRLDDEKNEVTQAQLKNQRTNTDTDVVTEKQLNNTDAPWARAATRNASMFKSAGEHMDSVISVMAETAVETGASPVELQAIARELVNGTQSRLQLANAIVEKASTEKTEAFVARANFWASKNVKVATASPVDIEKKIINKLRSVVADTTINPEVIIEAVDVVGEDDSSLESISLKIDEKLKELSAQTTKGSIKAELRQALSKSVKKEASTTKEERDSKRAEILASVTDSTRESERKTWETILRKQAMNSAALGTADMIIKTTFGELGSEKSSPSFKKDVVTFTKAALAAHDIKMASITNVTISGDTIQIAVQTDAGEESVEIPIGGEDKSPSPEETMPEGDMTGEGTDMGAPAGGLGSPEAMSSKPAAPVGGAPAPAGLGAPAPAGGPMPTASSKKTIKTAQVPSGGATGAPGAGAPEAGGPAGAAGAPPADQAPIQSLMNGSPEEAGAKSDEIPSVGDKLPPWATCPECSSNDVDVTNENGDIKGSCKACGAEYEAMIKKTIEFKIIKPTTSAGEEGEETPEAPVAPEVPALPVAASTRLDKGSIVRIAANKKQHGHVCPACGHKHCKASVETQDHVECKCDSCKTDFAKDIVVNTKNPADSHLMIQWDVTPDMNCPDCRKKAAKFASQVKVQQMIKTAAANKEAFPMANCMERLARTYGGDTVSSFGPCKGKQLSECVCKQLQAMGMTKVRHLDKLASASMQKDPMSVCVEDQKKQGYSLKEASSICGCIKKKFASKEADNILVHAFADDIASGIEKSLSHEDLNSLSDLLHQMSDIVDNAEEGKDAEVDMDAEIGDELPPADDVTVEVGECSGDACDKCGGCKSSECTCGEKCSCKPPTSTTEIKEEVDLGEPTVEGDEVDAEIEPENVITKKDENMKDDVLASSSKVRRTEASNIKMAGKPTKVETIEKDVEAGVPRGKATMGNEGKDNIDVDMAKPKVPRGNAYMGQEKGADSMINKNLELPDVATGNAYMGGEKEAQKGMPGTNNEIKGTVIAETDKTNKTAKKLTEVETVEKDVEAKVPRGKATIGNEGKDNVDVAMADPKVPRGNAYMGEEKSADSMINETLSSPDVPMGDGYMGNEKEVQKGMPANNSEMLKNVAKHQVHLDRIAAARKDAARDTAAWLASAGRIASDRETFDSVVQALASFEVDKIQKVADQMFPDRIKKSAATANTEASKTHTIPAIVMESKNMSNAQNDMMGKLAKSFTIGNKGFDEKLTIYGEKE